MSTERPATAALMGGSLALGSETRRSTAPMTRNARQQPARSTPRLNTAGGAGEYESTEVARRRDKRRRVNALAKSARRKNRK